MATRPVILAVDDEPDVLKAVERDLRSAYGSKYRIVRADSGAQALETLAALRLRNETVALFLSDQRMPEMTGVEFLENAIHLYPGAKRVLLTAYADTDAAIRAINSVKIDHYLIKPWSPPEERLFPVLNDLLYDWEASFTPPFEGLRIVGHRWSSKTHLLKDFLARNHVPYQWLDVETSADAARILQAMNAQEIQLPVAVFADGQTLADPSIVEVAGRIGLRTQAESPFYDLVIIGGGPAGLAAAVYGASEGLNTLLLEREAPGGQAGQSSRIENYLGFPLGLSGNELARRALDQARKFGAEVLTPAEAVAVHDDATSKIIRLSTGQEITTRTILIATGVAYRRLDVPGIDALTGAGVYYGAAMTEALSCRNEDVYIVGGANSAGQAAMYLSKYAAKVTMLVRGTSLADTMSKYLIDQIAATPNIVVRPCTQVTEAFGSDHLEAITILDSQTGQSEQVTATALFIFIGAQPGTDWLGDLVERDDKGFIFSGTDLLRDGHRPRGWWPSRNPYYLETSVPGIFVAGDVRYGSVKRVASGVGEGSMSVQFVHRFLAEV
ncbi:MAG: FAD-dependent oxidoreductase [bacterium]|nr:FAD-dependent oxidoreductase [bacterium]